MRAPDIARRHVHLVAPESLTQKSGRPPRGKIVAFTGDEARQIRGLDLVGVSQHEFTNTKAPQQFGEDRARSAKANDADTRPGQDGLACIAEQAALAIISRDGADGGNGVFAYGASSSFPSSTYNGTNYWVDMVFLPSP